MTKIIDYENLNYPMFETTLWEKICLIWAYITYVILPQDSYGLCFRINNRVLKRKVRDSLVGKVYLDYFLDLTVYRLGWRQQIQLRKIWIRKLLSYNPPVLELQPA